MKREDVEAILRDVLESAERAEVEPGDMSFRVEGDYLAALCRCWLAVEEADSMQVQEGPRGFGEVVCMPSLIGKRVRLVLEVES